MPSYTAGERRRLADALAGVDAVCPVCGGALDVRPVAPPPGVSYVRRRVWVLCVECRRSGAIDVRAGERP